MSLRQALRQPQPLGGLPERRGNGGFGEEGLAGGGVLEAQARMRQKGMSPAEAEMAAFEENAHDAMRVGGT